MKKILIVTYEMFPFTNNWGGCQRVHYMANKLSETEDVTVIASKNLMKKSDKITKLQKYRTLFLSNSLHIKIYASSSKESSINLIDKNKGFVSKLTLSISTIINKLFFNEPNKNIGIVAYLWSLRNTNKIISYIKQNEIEIAIISIPPWSIIRLSLLKKMQKLGCRIVIDYRDPWNCWNGRKGIPFMNEKRILKLADKIFVTNENHLEKLKSDFLLNSQKIYVVMNGYDSVAWNSIEGNVTSKSDNNLVISFIGAISFTPDSFRNPELFLKALSLFEHKNKIIFRVVGYYNEAVITKYENVIPHFEMLPNMSQKESFIKMLESDVLINFHTIEDDSSKYLIAGKIFDYYRSGARIFSINGSQSYERIFVENNRLGYCSDNDIQQIESTIGKIYQNWISYNSSFPRRENFDLQYSRQFQNEKVLKILYQLQ